MTIRRFRSPMKMCAAMLAITCFLTFGLGAFSSVLAADPPAPPPADSRDWETWPKKPEGSGPVGLSGGAETAGLAGGAKTDSGISAGTWGWIAGGAAVVLVIALAASGGGGGNGTSPPACNQ